MEFAFMDLASWGTNNPISRGEKDVKTAER